MPETPEIIPTDVTVIGEALIDIVRSRSGVAESPGGSPANVALALGRIGRSPVLLTQFADDERGRVIAAWLEASGVDVVAIAPPSGRTSTAAALLDDTGAATYEFDLEWAPGEFAVGPTRILHTGSIASVIPPGADAVASAVDAARAESLITYDPNVRPSLVDDEADARERIARLRRAADVVKASAEDVEWLHPGRDLREVAREWLAEGPRLVVVTDGGAGSFAVHQRGIVAVEASAVTVVDTVGAGDTFMAMLIAQLPVDADASAARAQLDLLDEPQIEAILRRCAAAAAVTVSRAGANPPWTAELGGS